MIGGASMERVTVGDAAADGNITFEQQTESEERTFNGQKAPSEDLSKSKSTYTIAPDGTLVSLHESDPAIINPPPASMWPKPSYFRKTLWA